MSRISKSLAVLVAALACASSHVQSASAATPTIPQTLTQQGRLLDSDGSPVDGVQLTFTFSLYTTAAAGTAIWTENQSITPDNGYFSAKLGDVTAFTSDIFDGSQGTLYLGIKIGSDAEMAPRQELTSVPFAMLAFKAISSTHADNADLATKATSAVNADNATNASNATTANTVKSIYSNFVAKNSNLTAGSATLSCDTGQYMVGGFCYTSGTNAGVASTGTSSKGSYTCVCSGTSCSVIAAVTCAK